MNLSVKGEYALEAMLDLASHESGDPVKIADIARRRKIPQKFLELILANLRQGGFVVSKRGADGGYMLARPAETIMAGEVIRYIESRKSRPRSRHNADSPFADFWERVEQAVSRVVDHTSFAELRREWQEKQTRHVMNWEI